jgi:hypothetical protein
VFFDKGIFNEGWRYLEAAPNDQSADITWGCSGTSIPGTQFSLGSGEANTSSIVARCKEFSYAAKLCSDLTIGGQSDWFLPSRDEVNLMYKNLHLNGMGNFIATIFDGSAEFYWTSSQGDSDFACFYTFFNGDAPFSFKYSRNLVRAIRAY